MIAIVVVDLLLQLETAVEVLAKGFGRPGSGKEEKCSTEVKRGQYGCQSLSTSGLMMLTLDMAESDGMD